MNREYILSKISVDAVKELGCSDFDVEVYVTSRISLEYRAGLSVQNVWHQLYDQGNGDL